MIINVRQTVKAIANTIAHKEGLKVGIEALDNITYGVKPTELVFLASRPGMGKTSMLADILLHISATGVPLIFSMEMGQTQLIERLIVNAAGVSFQKAVRNLLQVHEKVRLEKAVELLSSRDILIEGASLQSPPGIERTLRNLIEAKVPVSCVLIDHLHYMMSEPRLLDLYAEVTNITKSLKALAREYNLPFIVAAQLNRGPELRQNHRPVLSDLRESGSIEQDADQVWFLYRQGYYETCPSTPEAEIIVAKNRNGPTGTAKTTWNACAMSFRKPQNVMDTLL